MTRRLMVSFCAVTMIASIVVSAASASVISLNFSENSNNQAFAGGENIGPIPKNSTNWNSTNGQDPLNAGTMTDLIDDSGNVTTASVTWSASNVWWNSDGTGNDEQKLAVGYLDDGGDGISVTMTGIPYDNYRVYGLYASDQGPDTAVARDMQVNGTWVFGGATPVSVPAYSSIAESMDATGQFWSRMTTTTKGNYWTINASGDLTITQSPATDEGRAALTGIEIKAIPEPATGMLVGIALVLGGMVIRRRRI